MANNFLESLFNEVTWFFRSVEQKQKEKEEEDERLKVEKEKREERERERQERRVERAARDRSV